MFGYNTIGAPLNHLISEMSYHELSYEEIPVYFFFVYSSEGIRLRISRKSSTRENIHTTYHALYSQKNKKKNLEHCLLQL